ncbi:hypothetical protein, conserved [Eimeria maxima]|uniref:Uncharacterized protein n=1 Tax=Eimeria maxima TaxID=5804 RepID=U6M1X4_EIMMA|nr:hypothetical protein, conserved [Eimeria maxima]CDJ58232.1 hypothetical protein, conserved [Eimeria maxima]
MLAEGGKWPGETQKALLDHGSGEEIEMQCLGASSAEETTESEQEGNKSLWSTLWSGKSSSMQHPPAAEGNREEEEEEKDTFLGPSTSSGSASSQDSARHRVEHKTHLFLGYSRSPHYERPNEYYGFPRIGGENEQLRDALTSLQDFAWDLCLAHTEPSTRVFQAEVLLKNCSGIAVVHIRVEEQPFGSRGPLDFLVGEVQSLWRGVDHRHFRRDVACVVEEMLVKVLAEAEESGDQETTRLWSLIEKPKGVGTTGKVLLEVHGDGAG